VKNVDVVDPIADPAGFEKLLADRLGRDELSVIVARRPCILAAADIRKYEKAAADACAACVEAQNA
jgi:indolepyruvate ferredoxin oxidoreductase alpha subunit